VYRVAKVAKCPCCKRGLKIRPPQDTREMRFDPHAPAVETIKAWLVHCGDCLATWHPEFNLIDNRKPVHPWRR